MFICLFKQQGRYALAPEGGLRASVNNWQWIAASNEFNLKDQIRPSTPVA